MQSTDKRKADQEGEPVNLDLDFPSSPEGKAGEKPPLVQKPSSSLEIPKKYLPELGLEAEAAFQSHLNIIKKADDSFIDTGLAMAEIRENGLWRCEGKKFNSFAAFYKSLEFSPCEVSNYIAKGKVLAAIRDITGRTVKTSHATILLQTRDADVPRHEVDPAPLATLYMEISGGTEEKLTAKVLREGLAKRDLLPPKRAKQPTKSKIPADLLPRLNQTIDLARRLESTVPRQDMCRVSEIIGILSKLKRDLEPPTNG